MIKKILISLGIIISITITISYFLITNHLATKVTIINQSNFSIVSATANFRSEKIDFPSIESEKSFKKTIKINSDGIINLKINFNDNSFLEGKSSYVTGNDATNNIFTVTSEKKLEYKQS